MAIRSALLWRKVEGVLANGLADLAEPRTAGRGGSISCFGDSLTAGGYPAILSTYLRAPVLNRGVGGETSTQIADRFTPEAETCVLWMGNNNFYEPAVVVADIGRCVGACMPAGVDYRVVGLVIGDFDGRQRGQAGNDQIMACNAELSAIYRDKFIDLRQVLIAAAVRSDNEDLAANVLPRSLRVDGIHLNRYANVIVARAVARHLAEAATAVV